MGWAYSGMAPKSTIDDGSPDSNSDEEEDHELRLSHHDISSYTELVFVNDQYEKLLAASTE
jgi:hypothetical protein